MHERLLSFLKRLEQEIPPPEGCHHAICVMKFHTLGTEWRDGLALHVNNGIVIKTYWLEEGDLENHETAIAIVKGVAA